MFVSWLGQKKDLSNFGVREEFHPLFWRDKIMHDTQWSFYSDDLRHNNDRVLDWNEEMCCQNCESARGQIFELFSHI